MSRAGDDSSTSTRDRARRIDYNAGPLGSLGDHVMNWFRVSILVALAVFVSTFATTPLPARPAQDIPGNEARVVNSLVV